MRSALVLLAVLGCGGARPPSPPAPPPAAPAPPTTPVPIALTAEAVCDRIAALAAERCGSFAQIEMDLAACLREYRAATSSSERAFFDTMGRCIIDHAACDEVQACLAQMSEPTQPLRACDEDEPGRAVGLPAAEWAARNGAGATRFSQATSTPARPIEVCGIEAENAWLATLACDDGSRPITNNAAAENARVGNVGIAGRCGSIVDHYQVRCPERQYDLYLDAYICPLK